MRVLVVGGSDQGRQVIDVLQCAGTHEVVGVVDRGLPVGAEVMGHPVLARDDDVAAAARKARADGFIVAIGDNATRESLTRKVRSACPDLEPVTAAHPAAVVASDAVVGSGSILMAGAVIGNGSTVGAGALFGTNSSIDHDCATGDYVSLAPGAVTGGTVRIGSFTAVGVGASIIHGITIGAHTVVGAGAVVLADVPDLVVVYGVPARVDRARAAGEPYL